MKAEKLTVITSSAFGPYAYTYVGADFTVDPPFLVITHEDQKEKQRLLDRVPLANIVRLYEVVPKVPDA